MGRGEGKMTDKIKMRGKCSKKGKCEGAGYTIITPVGNAGNISFFVQD
jgi:hypothetical protein